MVSDRAHVIMHTTLRLMALFQSRGQLAAGSTRGIAPVAYADKNVSKRHSYVDLLDANVFEEKQKKRILFF